MNTYSNQDLKIQTKADRSDSKLVLKVYSSNEYCQVHIETWYTVLEKKIVTVAIYSNKTENFYK
jgi:hypothetical protein